MKSKSLVIALIIVFVRINVWAQSGEVHEFTLQQCIDYALTTSEQIKSKELIYKSDKALVGEILADGLPQLNANLDVGNNFKIPTTFIQDFISPSIYGVLFQESLLPPRNLGEPQTFPAQFGTNYSGTASISLTQLIFDGAYFIGIQAAKTFTELSKKDHIKTKIDVIEAVTKAYYTVLVTAENFELIQANYDRLDSLYRETNLLYENGFVEKIDASRVKVQLNNITVQKENMARTLDLSYNLLKFQMAMPINEALELTETLADIEIDLEIDGANGFEYGQRIEYSSLQTSKELALIDIRNIKSQYLPKLEGYATLGSSTGTQSFSDLFDLGDNWFGFGVVGLRMSVPIFDGLRKSHQIQQRKYKSERVDTEFSRLTKAIDMQIEKSKLTLENSIRNMEVQKENMALAQEVFEVSRQKYKQGVGSNLEVINADTAYKQAQNNYYSALYETLLSKVDYQKALGKLN